jgi:hypothetical protein
MSSAVKSAYGSNNQGITITLASLANSGARASTVVDNTVNVFLDALVSLVIKTGASGVVSTGSVNIYAYGTTDGGTNYSDGATGTDAGITLTSPPNAKIIGVGSLVANATTYKIGPFSVAAAFGGVLPDHWGIIVQNNTGGSFDSTEGNHTKDYQGYYQNVG